jgi:hypothetical protein
MADNLQNKLLTVLLGGGDNDEISALKNSLVKAIIESEIPKAPPSDYRAQTEMLKAALEALHRRHEFKVGQLVKWKKGLRYKNIPDHNQPGIVLEILPEPIVDPVNDSNSIYFRDLLDIKIGIILPNTGDMASYYLNSARFEPY